MRTAEPLKPYLLLFRNAGPETHEHLSKGQRQQLVEKWNAWYEGLARQGKALEGSPLETQSRMVSSASGTRVIDGPYPEAKEAIGGYVKLLASSIEEASKIAELHPGLPYGMQIEVRQVTDSCHLGVLGHSAAPTAMATA